MHTIERKEYLYQNWYDVIRPSTPCPAHAPNYDDDGWLAEVSNPVCYGVGAVSTEEQSCGVGNPTLPGTGTKVHIEIDYAPSFSHPIPFERHYRSRQSVTALQTTNGWTHTYNANNLNTRITELTDGVQTQQWNLGYNANGDLIQITDVMAGNAVARVSMVDSNGRVLAARNIRGDEIRVTYSLRGFVTSLSQGGQLTRYLQNPIGQTSVATLPNGKRLVYEYDSSQRLLDIKLEGVSLSSPSALRMSLAAEPPTRASQLMEVLRRGLLKSIPSAHAQAATMPGRVIPLPIPGQEHPGQPAVSAWDLMMQSEGYKPLPTATLIRRIARAIDRLCECDPNGYSKPTLTFLSVSKMVASGHVPAVLGISIPGQSAFDASITPNQAFVDEVVIRAGKPTANQQTGNLEYYVSNMGGQIGTAFGRFPTKAVRLIVAPDCPPKGSPWKPGEVVSFYPDIEGKIQ
jgi:hypothetical protein